MKKTRIHTVSSCLGITSRLSAAALLTQVTYAGDIWVGGTSGDEQNWNNAANWGGAFPTGNAQINIGTGNFPIISGDSAFTPIDIFVGTAGNTGRLDHRAGVAATGNNNWMFVGQGNLGNGTYNLADTSASGGSLTGFGLGSGSLNVGGSSTTGGRLLVGDGGSSIGVVNMNTSGTLKTEEDGIGAILGNGGTSSGTFRLDGGTVQINSALNTGIALLAGTNGGDGTFLMSGGAVNANGGIWVGDNNAGSQGLIDITGGTLTGNATGTGTQAGQNYIGRGLGQGTFNVSGTANVSLTGSTHIGYSTTATAGTAGTLAVSGGTFLNTGELRIGSSAGNSVAAAGSGTFNLTGGTATVTANLVFARGNDAGDLITGQGTVSGAGTTLNVGGDLVVAYAGNNNLGQLTISSGTVNVANTVERWLVVNQWDTARGQLTVDGGNVNLNTNSDLRFSTNGSTGASVATLNGGAITSYSGNGTGSATSGLVDLNFAGGAAANNTFNLNGGTLTVAQVITTSNNGTAAFNFNGGTLKASNTSAAFVDLGGATQSAKVRNGGAIIDSNGFDVTIGQALVHSDIGGDNAVDGGLTKKGTGSLTLTGTHTYTGATSVEAGSLVINGNISTSILTTVQSGATLLGVGTTGDLTVLSGGTLGPGNSPGILNVGDMDLQLGASLNIELNGVTAGTGYDQLNVTGTTTLAGLLSLTTGFTPTNGDLFFILLNDDTDAVNGTFAGLANNATLTSGGQEFQISYFGDSGTNSFTGGNDVVLMAVPEPRAAILGGLGILALLRRRRVS